jgi:futalosine hydrolase
MSFKILYVTATYAEAEAVKKIRGMISVPGGYFFGNLEICILVTGVGSVTTAWTMMNWLSKNQKPDLAINAGISGSFRDNIRIGDVVLPVTDCFADAGIEDGEDFVTLFKAGLADAGEFPFRSGIIPADPVYSARLKSMLRPVNAITVNTATGSEASKNKLIKFFNPDIETMEGATFFYICVREEISFLAVRAISNIVELRNKSNWNIALALDSLSEKLSDVLKTLE